VSQFDEDFASANDLLAEAFGEEVTIARGAASTPGVTAQCTLRQYEASDRFGATTTIQSADFVADRTDYDFGGGPVEPRTGDRITRIIGGATVIFEVMPIGDGRPAEWADEAGDQWLIHTKRVS
jgi:hypothetical protein